MRNLLLATAAAVLFSSPVFAADLAPAPAEPVAPYLPFTWTGPYVGVQAGYGWGQEEDNLDSQFNFDPFIEAKSIDFSPFDLRFGADEFDMDGFAGGVHAGYNWQINQFVVGVEGDVELSSYEGDQDFSYSQGILFGNATADGTLSMESDWQASLRLRAGLALDRLLIYGTGGIAFADAELSASGSVVCSGLCSGSDFDASDSQTLVGWTAGLGLEYAFTNNLTARAEGRYTRFGEEDFDLGDVGEVEAGFDQWAIRVGVSYKFGNQ